MIKKLLSVLLLAAATTSAFAQFEAGKKYVGASLSNFNMSYSDSDKFSMGLNLKGGYFVERDIMAVGEFGFLFGDKDFQNVTVNAGARYYFEQNGIFAGANAKFTHTFCSFNDLAVSPEIGYCYFLNKYVTIEPSVYFDFSLTDFSDNSRVGLKLGLAIYF